MNKEFTIEEYTERRTVLHEIVPLWTPMQFIFLISTPCNFRCNYCINAKPEESPVLKYYAKIGNLMKYADFCHYVDRIAEHIHSPKNISGQKMKVLSISGFGEPLLNPHVADMVAYAKKADIAETIRMFTNGTLLTHKMSDRLITSGLGELKVSLQGIDAEDYSRVCKYEINFEKFVEGIAYFYKNRNYCHVYVKIADLALNEEKDSQRRFEEIFAQIADKVNIEHITPGNAIPYSYEGGGVMRNSVDSNVCNNIFRLLELQIDGELYPCARYDGTGFAVESIGNLKEKAFGDLWNKGKHKLLCEAALKHQTTGNCAGCKYFNFISSQKDILDGHEDDILSRMQ
jgi:radical SAM protein with 4Fe4S-binding SPASM domain